MDFEQIRRYMPHAYPMLLLDRVLAYECGKTLQALKNITANEPQFPGHFPHRFVYPGVLTCEAMFQAGTLLGIRTLEDEGRITIVEGELPGYTLLTNIESFRFRRPVVPGDQLIMTARLLQFREARDIILGILEVKGTVDGEVCAKGKFKAVLSLI